MMATYGQRDKFLQAVVTFTISDQAKEMPPPERQAILIKIRDRYAPDISNAEWGDIANGINNFKFVITDSVKYGEVPTIIDQLPETEVDYQKTQADSPHLDESMKKDVVVPENENQPETEDPNYENSVDVQELDDSEDNSDLEDKEGESKEDDYTEDEKPREPEPVPEPAKVFGKFTKPKEPTHKKVSTSKLRGLLKPKK